MNGAPAPRGGRRRRAAARASAVAEYLVLLRSPEKLGYWHLVAGGVEWGEAPAAAAARELGEETGLVAEPASARRAARVRPRRRSRVGPGALPAGHDDDRRLAVRRRRAARLGARCSTTSTSTTAGSTPTARSRCSTTRSRARRCEGRRVVRVGIDTTPLVQTRAGTARHVLGLLGELDGTAGARARRPLRRAARDGSRRVRRDALWYPFRLGARLRAGGRPPLHDVPRAASAAGAARRHRARPRPSSGIPEAFPRWHRTTGALALCARASRAADAVVAVSAFTRDELVELLGVPASGSASCRTASTPCSHPTARPPTATTSLRSGTLEPRKNLAAAVEAARLADVELRVAGAAGWGGSRAEGWVGEPTDEELAALMRGARCLVYPSLYEGFGVPDARGDGVRHAGGDEPRRRDRGGRGRRRGARRPARPGRCRGIERRRTGIDRRRGSMFTWRRSADVVADLAGAREAPRAPSVHVGVRARPTSRRGARGGSTLA